MENVAFAAVLTILLILTSGIGSMIDFILELPTDGFIILYGSSGFVVQEFSHLDRLQ
jgi:hypothetical protein